MEILHQNAVKTDNTLLAVTHLTQLISYATGFGSLIVPLVLWLSTRNRVEGMDEHGKAIINLQLSLILYIIISIPAILLLGLGLLGLLGVAILGFILPIVNAVKASNGESPSYFMTIKFL
ncbi:DUF4870 domain-containing protein [Allomuricauda sp. F6463D]|uniref:DUF4870 domain-containing protein n=1 Tax=Allomuricauda sp. F6463D TaxID=2926409 RepID=UPI001FF51F5E|nr:DUF4870 domain-containing protein [Muricauda sp. F6463D]MCK0159348.1 DUF4870 domain-containing protein [Muricauda sp. F6463D]